MILRRPLVRFQNDMKACFDRILSHLVQINNQSFGLSEEIAKIVGKPLHEATYYIKTGMGVSATGYKHMKELEVWSTGQGSVASMYIGCMIVSQLLQLHDKYRYGAKYKNDTTMKDLIIGMLSFVDDCNLFNNGEKYETLRDILKRIQHDAQFWNDIIRSSGGALELSKCFMQVIYFNFATNGTPYGGPPRDDLHVEIINRNNNEKVRINSISSHDTYRSLGTMQGIAPKQRKQFKQLQQKAKEHTRALISSQASSRQA